MILDSLSGFERYLSLHPRFAAAYKFMRRPDFMQLPAGSYPIEGTEIYCNIIEAQGRTYEQAKLEVHDSYIDLQVVLEGEEIYGHKDRSACPEPSVAYNPEKDIAFFDCSPTAFISVEPGQVAVFFPHDAHAPLIGQGPIKKAIIKVLF